MVVGESMEPTMSQGDLVVAKGRNSYSIGDIVAYRSPYGPVVIHRIVAIDGDNFITQGDNRDSVDSWVVTRDMILGKSLVAIPYVGFLFNFLRQPIMLALFIAALFLALIIPSILLTPKERRGRQRRTEKKLKAKRRRRERALARWLPLPLARPLSHLS
jgi:signal peptidase I